MSEHKFYLPIKSVNLPHYFVEGIISPTKYIENRNNDLQDRFDNYLLLSDQPFTTETNCALELVFDKKKEDPQSISDNFFLYDKPLPVSRIRQVIFQDDKQKMNSVFNITSGGAFLPDSLLTIPTAKIPLDTTQLEKIHCKGNGNDWTASVSLFNRMMGGFALMKNVDKDKKNYSLNYVSTLGSINSLVKDSIENKNIPSIRNYEWVFLKNREKTADLRAAIYTKINKEFVEKFARKAKVETTTKNGRLIVQDKNTQTYYVNILGSYGEGTRGKLDSFFSDFYQGKFPKNGGDGLVFMFGFNKGYKVFRNAYKTQNFEVDVKFKLDSQLDYYTIESIYQFSINEELNNKDFDYLNEWCVKAKPPTEKVGYTYYDILDKRFYKKKEICFTESFHIFFDKLCGKESFKVQLANFKKDPTKELKDFIYFIYKEQNLEIDNNLNSNNPSDRVKYSQEPKEDELATVSEPVSAQYQKLNINIGKISSRRKELESFNITNLRKEGKKLGIKGTRKWENTSQGKQLAIEKILKKLK